MQSPKLIIAFAFFALVLILLGGVTLLEGDDDFLTAFFSALRSIGTVGMLVCGLWGPLAGLGLRLGKVQPGKIWGYSALGNLLMGSGGLLGGLVALYGELLIWWLLAFLVPYNLGLWLHHKARHRLTLHT